MFLEDSYAVVVEVEVMVERSGSSEMMVGRGDGGG